VLCARCAVLLKDKLMLFVTRDSVYTFTEIVGHPGNTFNSRLAEKQLAFLAVADTVTDLINIERLGNRRQETILLPRSYLVHTVDGSRKKWFTYDQVIT